MWDRFKERSLECYHGSWVPYESEYLMGGGHRPHWSARVAQIVVNFWLEHWKYIITTTIAVAALIVAYKKIG